MLRFFKNRKLCIVFLVLLFAVLPLISNIQVSNAAGITIFVDNTLLQNCGSNYSIISRNCSGSDGVAFKSIAEAITAGSAGTTISIRAGTYTTPSVNISYSGLQTIIEGYGNEDVTIYKSTIRLPIFYLSSSSNNIIFRNLKFRGEKNVAFANSWTLDSGNVWKLARSLEVTGVFFNNTKGVKASGVADVNAANKWFWLGGFLYVYSTGNPFSTFTSPSISETDDYDSIAIGSPNGGPGQITVDDCDFANLSHAGVKGSFRWDIKNSIFNDIGTDFNDHHIYTTGKHSLGSEAVIEYNYFGYTPGASIHLFSSPSYQIVKYNIINGKNSAGKLSFWGILLAGDHISVYNNTIYGASNGIMFYSNTSHDNLVKNNILDGNTNDFAVDLKGGSSLPLGNTTGNNYLGSGTVCSGCTDKSASGGDNYTLYDDPPNIINSQNPFASSSFNSWSDFKLSNTSLAINSGANLGTNFQLGIDPNSSLLPALTMNQNNSGSGWEIGAFIFGATSTLPLACHADYNSNGTIDIADFAQFAQNYKRSGISCSLDITGGDCFLNILDFSEFGKYYKVNNLCI